MTNLDTEGLVLFLDPQPIPDPEVSEDGPDTEPSPPPEECRPEVIETPSLEPTISVDGLSLRGLMASRKKTKKKGKNVIQEAKVIEEPVAAVEDCDDGFSVRA